MNEKKDPLASSPHLDADHHDDGFTNLYFGDDQIPTAAIGLAEAYTRVFSAMISSDVISEAEDVFINTSEESCEEDFVISERTEIASDRYVYEQRRANRFLRAAISAGELVPFVSDEQGALPLGCRGWDLPEYPIATAIFHHFVSPSDPDSPGPDTERGGRQRAVYFYSDDFESWFTSTFPQKQKKRGRPKGSGKYPADPRALHYMASLIIAREALNPNQAAIVAVAEFYRKSTGNSVGNHKKRLRQNFLKRWPNWKGMIRTE